MQHSGETFHKLVHHHQTSSGCNIFRHLLLIFIIFFLGPSSVTATEYEIEIVKSKQELAIKDGDEIIKKYRVALGKGGKGTKRKIGDKKTPTGIYKVMDFKSDSKFHFFIHIDYPNLLDAWYGYKNEIISASEFKDIATAYKNENKPPQSTALGGYIGIHGLGDESDEKLFIHEEFNWTEGCIALTNNEVVELRQYVEIGTRIVIKE